MTIVASINPLSNAAQCQIYDGEDLIVSFDYDSLTNIVSISANLSQFTISFDEFLSNRLKISNWLKLVIIEFNPIDAKPPETTAEFERDSSEYQLILKNGSYETKIKYNDSQNNITIEPSLSDSLTFGAFVFYNNSLNRFLTNIKDIFK